MLRVSLALSFLLGLLCSPCLTAQNESGSRYLNKERFQFMRYWYDSTTAMYQVRYPIIRNIPPLSSGMPYDIMLSYIVADSLCRFAPQKDVTKLIDGWAFMNDTLRNAAKYLYKMVDYNPGLFNQYQDQIMLLRNMPFKTSLYTMNNDIQWQYKQYVPVQERSAIASLLGADYILRIKVVTIDSMPDKLSSGNMRYRVTAQVVDTLKGHIFQPAQCGSFALKQTDANHSFPCMYFQYVARNYFDPFSMDFSLAHGARYEPWPYHHQDSAFMRAPNVFAMKPGQEAIVFLLHETQRLDHEADYYDINLSPRFSYNALPIIGGQVRDVNNVWSSNLWMSYPDWKARFIELRDKILNGSY